MTARVDILDERESLRRPLAASLVFHVSVVALSVGGSWYVNRGKESWGFQDAQGGGIGYVTVTPSQIPLPQRAAPPNPVANPTQSSVPSAPPEKAAKKPSFTKEELDAIALAERKKAMRELDKLARNTQKYRSQPDRPNQLYSSSGAAAASPMFGVAGSGGVGVGPNSVLGNRFGWYAQMLQQRIASKWNTGTVDPRIQNAPVVIVVFDILRNGAIRDLHVLQSSGVQPLDFSALRAVQDASPFDALPAQYEKDSVNVEFWFKLRR